ncbi:hypothetical protein DXG01_014651, partial [Tephrocybe rancida]
TIDEARKKATAAKKAFLDAEEKAISEGSAGSKVQDSLSEPAPTPSVSESPPEAPKRPVARKRVAPQADASQVKLARPISIEGKSRSSSPLSEVPSDLEPLVVGKIPTDVGITNGPTAAPLPTIVEEHGQSPSEEKQEPTPTTTVPPGGVMLQRNEISQQPASTLTAQESEVQLAEVVIPPTAAPLPTIVEEHAQLSSEEQQEPAPTITAPPGGVVLQRNEISQQPASTLTAQESEVQLAEVVMKGLIKMSDDGESEKGSDSDSPLAKAS